MNCGEALLFNERRITAQGSVLCQREEHCPLAECYLGVSALQAAPYLVACCHARNGTEWVLVSWKVHQTQQEKQQGQQRVARTHPAKPGDW